MKPASWVCCYAIPTASSEIEGFVRRGHTLLAGVMDPNGEPWHAELRMDRDRDGDRVYWLLAYKYRGDRFEYRRSGLLFDYAAAKALWAGYVVTAVDLTAFHEGELR